MRVSDETPRDEDEAPVAPAADEPPGETLSADAATPDAGPPEIPSEAVPEDAIEAVPPDDAAQSHLSDEAEEAPAEEDPSTDPEGALEQEPEAGLEPPLAIEPTPAPPPRRPRPARPAPPVKPTSFLGKVARRLAMIVVVVGVLVPVTSTLLFRFVPPPVTLLMVQRLFEGRGLDHRWMSLSRMSPALPNAVIAAEDAGFCGHWGFDFKAMEKAVAHNQRRPGKIRGGSTISQQTAKNVFLWPQRSYVRKGLEAYFTVLIETLWGKRRIMEVYLNSVEWGPGVYGADSASRHYFGIGADQLTGAQASRLAAILPSPLKWKAAAPGPYVRKRSRRIGAASGTVRREGLAACVR
ncbi:MAG: monofunctional biosynthetic peptidoglycan transglycosylase [Caulobacter sp.]|nr:monofunctional biosynthetic peptidoglycan transglycosylase [Caulobacter sp.]